MFIHNIIIIIWLFDVFIIKKNITYFFLIK